MNTYYVSYQGPFAIKSVEVQASNIHTAVKKVLYPATFRAKPVAIRQGQTMIIQVTRLS